MRLAVDIGNTETAIGVFDALELKHSWRVATERRRTGDEVGLQLRALLKQAAASCTRAVVGSVVPALNEPWRRALEGMDIDVRFLEGAAALPVELDVDAPAEVGADRIANTLAATHRYARNTVVVDLGTATTFDCITAEGVFKGGVIAPGPRAGIDRLTAVATLLPQVEIRVPSRVIGRRTVECLDAGVFFSTVDAIDGITRRILEEWGPADPLVVGTGGLAGVFAGHSAMIERLDPDLTVLGLALAVPHLFDELPSDRDR